MQHFFRLGLAVVFVLCPLRILRAQDLAPRAYLITPIHSDAVILTWSFYNRSIDFNGLPISATGTYCVPIFSYYHTFGLLGRSANIVAAVTYATGNFQGTALGAEEQLYRSGLVDSAYRLPVNLRGARS